MKRYTNGRLLAQNKIGQDIDLVIAIGIMIKSLICFEYWSWCTITSWPSSSYICPRNNPFSNLSIKGYRFIHISRCSFRFISGQHFISQMLMVTRKRINQIICSITFHINCPCSLVGYVSAEKRMFATFRSCYFWSGSVDKFGC